MSVLGAVMLAAAVATTICTDRPTEGNAVCTVPKGKLQIESSFTDWSVTKVQASRTTVLTVAPTTAKLGLSSRSDVEISVVPHAEVRVGGRASVSGVGDVVIRYKQRLAGEGAAVQFAMIPFVKIPAASRRLGNGKVEYGLAVPVSFPLLGATTMTLGPEADLVADVDGRAHHIAIIGLVNVAGSITPRLTLTGELWSNVNLDPVRTVQQLSADAGLVYAASTDLLVDAGVNRGLTRDTPDWQLYGGVSIRI
jgi:hypothetical protein